MNLTNDPGLWQHFVNRFDNVGRPIMEVKQKYLLEINAYESTLTSGNPGAGGGTASTPTPSTQAPTVYSFPLFNCLGRIPFPNDTAYSLSSTFTAGIQIFQNPSLTNLINPGSVGNPIDIYDIQGTTTTDHYGLQADGYVVDSGGDCGN